MRFTTTWCEEKTTASGAKLIQGTFKDVAGDEHEATIWEKDKDGKLFPGFDLIGKEPFEGELWTKPSDGKKTIYPPKPVAAKGSGGAGRTAMMEKTMEKKATMIGQAQDKKGEAIQMASVMRDAVLIATEELKSMPHDESYEVLFKKRFNLWRAWLTNRWDDKAEDIAVPFD